MVNLQPDFELGENVLKNTEAGNFATVELESDVIRGEVVKVTGINTDGTEKVALISSVTDDVKYMIMETGLIGQLARVLFKGRTKATFGATFTSGERLEFTTSSKVIVAAGVNFTKAIAVDGGSLDDEGFIDFDGGLTPI